MITPCTAHSLQDSYEITGTPWAGDEAFVKAFGMNAIPPSLPLSFPQLINSTHRDLSCKRALSGFSCSLSPSHGKPVRRTMEMEEGAGERGVVKAFAPH